MSAFREGWPPCLAVVASDGYVRTSSLASFGQRKARRVVAHSGSFMYEPKSDAGVQKILLLIYGNETEMYSHEFLGIRR